MSVDQLSVKPKILDAFNANWKHFPFPVMLLTKEFEVVSVNSVATKLGIQTGCKCYELSGDSCPHKECKARIALRKMTGKRSVAFQDSTKQVLDSYWIPYDEEENLYIHFATDITEYAKADLFPS